MELWVTFFFSLYFLLFCFFLSYCLKTSSDQEWSIFLCLKCYQIKTELGCEDSRLTRPHSLWCHRGAEIWFFLLLKKKVCRPLFILFYFIETLLFKHLQTIQTLFIMKALLRLKLFFHSSLTKQGSNHAVADKLHSIYKVSVMFIRNYHHLVKMVNYQ